jgi:uroporphyrinogen III methyltransferase/synthase
MVYLVGAGPGDPELLTLKGKRALEKASVVLYDHLAPESVLAFAPPGAVRIYVGKKRARHAYSQDEICAMLIHHAQAGQVVVRLKGGDPYLFGRGGEEAEALFTAGVPFEVIPGVTSAAGIAAYSGVPLTHRSHASAVTFVTGHEADALDWGGFSNADTLVILMGLTQFAGIAQKLIAGGRSPETPAIAVRWGTRPDQLTIFGTLATLPRLVEAQAMKPPATIIVGEVARLHSRLNWFERLPLFGKRIVVTRPREQAGGLVEMLRDLGAQPIEFPVIQIAPADDYTPLDRALETLADYDWLVFTSVNGVRAFLKRLDSSKRDLRALRAKLAAIGPATREALEQAHLKVDVTGDEFVAESLAAAIARHSVAGAAVLLVRAAEAREYLPDFLRARGARVDVVAAYRTLPTPDLTERAWALEENPPDWITFTSSSTVDHFFAAVDVNKISGSRLASIGPVTSARLRMATPRKPVLEPTVEATEYTVAGLLSAILSEYNR